MTNQQLAVQQSINNTVVGYFSNEVSKYIRSMPGIISDSEGRRLAISLVIKASAGLEESRIDWKSVDTKKFINDLVRICVMGLDAGNNEAYTIPYKNAKSGKVDLQCMPSAKGINKLVLQYAVRPVDDVRSFVIKEGDKFTVVHKSNGDTWEYEEDVFGTGKTRGYVTIVVYEDGACFVMTHSKEDIEKRRKASKAPDSPAWTKWYDEMAIAKAVRRHCNKVAIKMPSTVQDAFDAMDDEQVEQQTKDVTPPTISLNSGPESTQEEAQNEPEQDQEDDTAEADYPEFTESEKPQEAVKPAPATKKPEPQSQPAPAVKTAPQKPQKPEQVQLGQEPSVAPAPEPPYYDPNDTSWMS